VHRPRPFLLLATTASCGTPPPVVVVVLEREADDTGFVGSESHREADGIELEGVTWTVDWNDEGLTPLDGGGWQVERADGSALQLYEGWLVVYTLVLEPCEPAATRGTPPPHGYSTHPSRAPEPVALALHMLAPTALGTATFPAEPFCDAGVTIFRGEDGNPGMPDDGSLDGLSFRMNGALRRVAEAPWEPFEMQSHLSAEHDLPLVGTADGTGAVDVVFSPAHLIDDISLDLEPDRIALGAIANLTKTATATLSTGP